MNQEFDKAPFPPPNIDDLIKNENSFGELRIKYKENKEIVALIQLALSLNAECRKSRNEMWSNAINHNFYGNLMKEGRLVVLALPTDKDVKKETPEDKPEKPTKSKKKKD